MRKAVLISIFISTLSFGGSAFGRETGGNFGVGIILGAPTAITAKYWLDSLTALDMGLAFAVSDYVLFYGDYLFHYPGAFKGRARFVSELTPYLGIGGVLASTTADRSRDDRYLGRKSGALGLGVRVPFGIEWQPARPPLGIFVEVVPGISVIPETAALFHGGIGIRYYF